MEKLVSVVRATLLGEDAVDVLKWEGLKQSVYDDVEDDVVVPDMKTIDYEEGKG